MIHEWTLQMQMIDQLIERWIDQLMDPSINQSIIYICRAPFMNHPRALTKLATVCCLTMA